MTATMTSTAPVTPGQLLDSMMITSGAMTNRIDRLERRGFVKRTRSKTDGRQVLVGLTKRGITKVDAALVDHAANEVLSALPRELPTPRLIGSVDIDEWVAIVVEWVDGRTAPLPLSPASVHRVLALVERLAQVAETVDVAHLRTLHEQMPELDQGWRTLTEGPPKTLDDWSQRHLSALVELEEQVEDATAGDALLHLDLRTDNMLFADAGGERDVVVDWPNACRGAAWVDLVTMLPSLHLDGAPPPQDVLAITASGRAAEPAAVDACIAGLAGYFTYHSLLPDPPGLPTLRPFQAAQAEVSRQWLSDRLHWH